MRKCFIPCRPEVFLGLATGVAMLVCSAQALSQPSVRAELIRLQDEKGLTLAWVDNSILTRSIDTHTPMSGGVQAIMFKKRTIVPLKDSLQDFRPDTFDFREYPQLSGIGECWSYDQTKLVDTMIERPSGRAALTILDLASKRARAVAINVDQKKYVTSQCWSPDGKRLVYEMDDAVRLYELGNDQSDSMAKGTDPTWSPDGKLDCVSGSRNLLRHAPRRDRKEETISQSLGRCALGPLLVTGFTVCGLREGTWVSSRRCSRCGGQSTQGQTIGGWLGRTIVSG